MRKVVGGALALAAVLAGASTGSAAAAPACVEQQAAIEASAPAWVNAGGTVALELQSYAPADAVTGLTATIGGAATPLAVPAYGSATIAVPVPSTLGRTTLAVTWEQGATDGWPACSGHQEIDLLVLAASVRIGIPETPHAAGRWTSYYTPIDYAQRPWKLTARFATTCDVGACAFGAFETKDGTVYRTTVEPPRPSAGCTITKRINGRKISRRNVSHAYLVRHDLTVRVTLVHRFDSGLIDATRIEGVMRSTLRLTGAGRARGCPVIRKVKHTHITMVRR